MSTTVKLDPVRAARRWQMYTRIVDTEWTNGAFPSDRDLAMKKLQGFAEVAEVIEEAFDQYESSIMIPPEYRGNGT